MNKRKLLKGLAEHLGVTANSLKTMEREQPKMFELMWAGWLSEVMSHKVLLKSDRYGYINGLPQLDRLEPHTEYVIEAKKGKK